MAQSLTSGVFGLVWPCCRATRTMNKPLGSRIKRFLTQPVFGAPCPEIRWQDVVRIEATGTDGFGAFQIWLDFTYSDGGTVTVFVEMKGYWGLVDSLHARCPSISPTWYDEMAEQPWHVEEVLYAKDDVARG